MTNKYTPRNTCISRRVDGGACKRAAINDTDVCAAHTQHPTPPVPDAPWNAAKPGEAPKTSPKGAPRKFDDKAMERAVDLAGAGLGLEGIARSLGISRRTLSRRMQADAAFAEDLDNARESAIEVAEQRLYEIGLAGNVQALLGFLKAHRPERYSERANNAVNLMIGGQAQVAVVGELAPGDQDERIKALLARLSPERQLALGLPVLDAEVVSDESE